MALRWLPVAFFRLLESRGSVSPNHLYTHHPLRLGCSSLEGRGGSFACVVILTFINWLEGGISIVFTKLATQSERLTKGVYQGMTLPALGSELTIFRS